MSDNKKAGGPFTQPTKAENTVSPLPELETLSEAAMLEILLDAAIAAVTVKANDAMQECDERRRMVEVCRTTLKATFPQETLNQYLVEQGLLRARWRKVRVALSNALNDLAQDWEKGATP